MVRGIALGAVAVALSLTLFGCNSQADVETGIEDNAITSAEEVVDTAKAADGETGTEGTVDETDMTETENDSTQNELNSDTDTADNGLNDANTDDDAS